VGEGLGVVETGSRKGEIGGSKRTGNEERNGKWGKSYTKPHTGGKRKE